MDARGQRLSRRGDGGGGEGTGGLRSTRDAVIRGFVGIGVGMVRRAWLPVLGRHRPLRGVGGAVTVALVEVAGAAVSIVSVRVPPVTSITDRQNIVNISQFSFLLQILLI